MITPVKAHVALDYPAGGETFSPGENVTITWHITIPHEQENWDLYFSVDGGVNWLPIVTDLSTDRNEYEWIIPSEEVSFMRIKVVMDNVSADYEAASTDFTIAGFSEVNEETDINDNVIQNLKYHSGMYNTTVFSFKLTKPEMVNVEIYDLTGSLVKTLLNEILSPGDYSLEFVDQSNKKLFIYRLSSANFSNSGIFLHE